MRHSNFSKVTALVLGLLVLFAVETQAQQKEKEIDVLCQLCPTIQVETSSLGRAMLGFKAVVNGIPKDLKLTFWWTVANGDVLTGQGSPYITVRPVRGVTATIKVNGLDLACSSTVTSEYSWKPPPVASLLDRYSRLPFEINGAKAEGFVAAQDEDDWPSLEYLRSDYKSVQAVAHVIIREAEITGRIGGYENWRIVCEVLEPFKGKFKKGDTIEYFHGAEAGFKKVYFTGEKIVFVLRDYNKAKKSYRYSVLENSTLPPATGTLKKLRMIKKQVRG